MSYAIYDKAAQILANWSGEDAAARSSPQVISRQIVDMIVRELEESGAIALESLAAHDSTLG